MRLETFALSLGLTLLIELPMAWFFELRGRNLLAAICINTLTNPAAVFFSLLLAQTWPWLHPFCWQLPIEAAVIGVEWLCYKASTDAKAPFLLSVAANCASYGLGLALQLIF